MNDLSTLRTLFRYSDWANKELLGAAQKLKREELDRTFDIGPGTLRKTLLHVLAGETVWLRRWQGQRETPWPDESEMAPPVVIQERFAMMAAERDRFLDAVKPEDAARAIVYRDSKGSLFSAPLSDMMIQMVTHSVHHRAQGVNIFRRLGGAAPELDYMMWVRRPA